MPYPVVVEELALLAKVTAMLQRLPPPRTASEAPIVRELERLRARMLSGDELKDLSSLSEQYHHQASVLQQLRSVGSVPRVDPASPYFAHLRLREDGRERDLCLGHATCVEAGVRIVDWRDAPISKIFYGYRQGDEYDEEIAGRERVGQVVARRMVRIRGGVLDRVQAPEGDYSADPRQQDGWRHELRDAARLAGGEAAAIRVFAAGAGLAQRLGSGPGGEPMRADKRLPEITGLIDPAQFDLITRPSSGFLVVRGAAGSGKTTVALHRVAYLAYADPAIDGPQTLVVVFSRALQRFVGHLLPALGLQRVGIASYREWAADLRRRHYPGLPASGRDDAPAGVQRIKLHPLLFAALEEWVARTPGAATPQQALEDWAGVLVEDELIARAAERLAPGVFAAKDIARFVDWNRARCEEVFAALAGDDLAGAELEPEDDTLLLRAWQLRVGRLSSTGAAGSGNRPLQLRHLVIDEVQDFAAGEVRVLLDCLAPDASITLAGDIQQHVMEHGGFSSWSEFFRDLGIQGTEIETLRVTYRSSQPIAEFASALLGELRDPDTPVESSRSGPPVELFRFSDRGACVAFLADALRELGRCEPLASVAVLTPSAACSDSYFKGLEHCDLPRLRRVVDQDFGFSAGVEVTEIEQAKGLEFDYVLLVDVDASHFPDLPAARRRLHVGATRAIHQLWLTTVGTPSPLVAELWDRVQA